MKVKYKQDGSKEAGGSLYHQLPQTAETQRAKELSGVYSEVRNCCYRRVPVRCVG